MFSFVKDIRLIVYINLYFSFYVYALRYLPPVHYNISLDNREYSCMENTMVFQTSLFLYVGSALVLSEGAPFRNPLFKNRALTVAIIANLVLAACVVLFPLFKITGRLGAEIPSIHFRFLIILGTSSCILLQYLIEVEFFKSYIIQLTFIN